MQNSSSREYPARPAVNGTGGNSLLVTLASGWSLAGIAVIVCWLLFFNQIRGEWQVNPQYNYGYVVPFLGAILFWRRWPGRPDAAPGKAWFAGMLASGLFLLALPLRVMFEANPEWRLLYWLSGFNVLGISLCVLYRLGGARWVRYFAPPLLFMFIALPWPINLEQAAIQGLMQFVAGLTVSVVNILGIPALQHGNIIEVGAGMVGIDEACSGVRSLQSSLMLSLFLGEMNRWTWTRRVTLLGASMLFVLLANLVRTTFLVWTAARHGLQQMESVHDTAGILIMLIVLPGLLGLNYLMQPKTQRPEPAPSGKFFIPALPRWIGVTILLWLAAIEITNEAWYRAHENNLVANTNWSVAWPETASHFKRTAIPENSRVILRCDNSSAAAWEDDAGNDWSVFVLSWNPGRNSTQLAKGHRPDICLPAVGAKLIHDFGRIPVAADGFEMPFHYQTFETGDKLLHVFYCLWSDKIEPTNRVVDDSSRMGRIRSALAGERNLGQKVIEVVICGPETRDEAISLLRTQAPDLIRKS